MPGPGGCIARAGFRWCRVSPTSWAGLDAAEWPRTDRFTSYQSETFRRAPTAGAPRKADWSSEGGFALKGRSVCARSVCLP